MTGKEGLNRFNGFLHAGKPLKRLAGQNACATRLKPGVNESKGVITHIYESQKIKIENAGQKSIRPAWLLKCYCSFFFASSGTSILVVPTSLISTVVVRSMSMLLPPKSIEPVTW